MAAKSWSNAPERRVAALRDFNEAVANAGIANRRLDEAVSALQDVDLERDKKISAYKALRGELLAGLAVGWTEHPGVAGERLDLGEKINVLLDEIDALEQQRQKAKSEEGAARSLSTEQAKQVRQKAALVRSTLPSFGPDDAAFQQTAEETLEEILADNRRPA